MANDNLDKFNSLIDQATKAIMCGPECQKEKTKNELKDKFMNAKTNLQTAPDQVHIAAKNYFVFTQGESGYNEYMETELNEKAEKIALEYKNNFDNDVSKATTSIETYNGLSINFGNVFDLYTKYKMENVQLEKELKNTTSDILTNDRKTFYEDQGIDSLKNYYSWLRILYIIIAVSFIISLFMFPSQLSVMGKLFFIFIIILYPFISTKLLGGIIALYHAIVNVLPKNMHRSL